AAYPAPRRRYAAARPTNCQIEPGRYLPSWLRLYSRADVGKSSSMPLRRAASFAFCASPALASAVRPMLAATCGNETWRSIATMPSHLRWTSTAATARTHPTHAHFATKTRCLCKAGAERWLQQGEDRTLG